jgi:hypothetical protein
MRLSASLTVVGALLLMSGVLAAMVGEAMRLNSPSNGQVFVRAGEILAAAGLACGLAVIVAVAIGASRRRPVGVRAARNGRAARSRRADERASVVQAEQAAGWGGSAGVEHAAAGWGGFASVTSQWPVGQPEFVAPPRGDAAAEEWLSQFRPVYAASEPEPETEPQREPEPEPDTGHEHLQERRVFSGYADDGWQSAEIPDNTTRWPEPVFAQDAAVVELRSRPETWSVFDPAPDPRRDYLAQSLPASEPEIPRVNGGSLHTRELSDSLAVDDLAVDDTVPLPAIADIPPMPEWPAPGPDSPRPVPVPARTRLDHRCFLDPGESDLPGPATSSAIMR